MDGAGGAAAGEGDEGEGDVTPDYDDMVPGMTHAQYRAIARMVKRLRDDRGDNHDALVDKRLEEEDVCR